MALSVTGRVARRLGSNRRGAASVELALISLPLLVFILAILELSFDFYAQTALDFALSNSVRQIATGNLQGSANSIATFQSVSFCPAVAGLLQCTSIAVNVTPVSNFTAASAAVPMKNGSFNSSAFTYCPGQPGQLMMAQAVYPAPSLVGQLLPGGLTLYGGQMVRLISSVSGFVNEQFTATAPKPAGC
jgi:Flp pilus assembly protein TadG